MLMRAYEETLKHLLNCYYREFKHHYMLKKISDDQYRLKIPCKEENACLLINVHLSPRLKSPIWQLPISYQTVNEQINITPLFAMHLILLALPEQISLTYLDDTLRRTINSAEQLAMILAYRQSSLDRMLDVQSNFLLSEQNHLLGHRLQPDGKSREGFNKQELIDYSPETQSGFKLHYFIVDCSITDTHSNLDCSVTEIIMRFLKNEPKITLADNQTLFVTHPWQASYLLQQPEIQTYLKAGKILDLGTLGPCFYATTSVRTVYSPEVDVMFKFSLNIAITNSVRVNATRECYRSVAVDVLARDKLKDVLAGKFPCFSLITDPAFAGLTVDGKLYEPSICIVRHNPFSLKDDVSCIASLTSLHPMQSICRLNQMVAYHARKDKSSLPVAAVKWLNAYLKCAIAPVLWLYSQYGIALEAHQQNLLVRFEDALPVAGFYRDSQGYYYIHDHPSLHHVATKEQLIHLCDGNEAFIDHHFCYYFIVNQLLAVIEALAIPAEIEEEILINKVICFLESFSSTYQTNNRFCQYLLTAETLPSKANLLTRLNGLDELQAPLERQSVYTKISNPLMAEVYDAAL
ncbi:IucA/IucC family protein [Cysteiniphilum sp. JM-1]|uniref:IucA/IucC family protein n=1 Tax=Cysteiniphilum sp. JM-1 TaxID=2610891 RepID=UPI0012475816|nr:IucA/IucC family protein [Cysteiniphilum sp. JM-1]